MLADRGTWKREWGGQTAGTHKKEELALKDETEPTKNLLEVEVSKYQAKNQFVLIFLYKCFNSIIKQLI